VETVGAEASASAWKASGIAHAYLGERRRLIPLWSEQAELLSRLIAHTGRPIRRFLDLGAGDGVLAEILLDGHPGSEAVLVDFSRPMLEAAALRLDGKSGRWTAVGADLSSPDWLRPLPVASGYDAVVSGFCIHHLPHERKRHLYQEVFELLAPGGAFLNWEHVSTRSWASGMFDERMVEGLVRLEQVRPSPRPTDEVAREYHARPDAAENNLLDPETQCGWLRSLGFESVDVYFRWLELALFGGIKPHGDGA
jgi:tRNA (cmo5U34)-methyltransferase